MSKKRDITIKDFVQAVNFKLDGGYEYLWSCYGIDAFGLGWTSADLSASAGMIYDDKTGVVYELSVWDDRQNFVLRWIRPGFRAKHDRESREKGFSPNVAIDKKRFRDSSPSECLAAIKKLLRRKTCAGKMKQICRR
jgi:hypothetical protein